MKNKLFYIIAFVSIVSFSLTACFNKLDLSPEYGLNTTAVYENPDLYIHVLAKLYAGLAVSGNQGPAGDPDIIGIDEGFSAYIRVLWNLQELPTDEVICAWNDVGIPELNTSTWNSSSSFVQAMYYRIFYQIPLCNEFIREASDANMSDRGFTDAQQSTIRTYRAEARFLRALSYYHAMDLFANVPFVTEEDGVGAFFPPQIKRVDLFDYIESELLAIESSMVNANANEYGRADKAAVWTLLAKIYLNSEVYNGTDRYADCATYCQKVIDAGYSLEPEYKHLFYADNHMSNEVIFPVTFDGLNTQTYGGTSFLVHASIGGSMPSVEFGVANGWGGNRATSAFVNQFPDIDDTRNMFYTDGQTLEIEDVAQFTQGYAVAKWRNITQGGEAGSDPVGQFVDIDFPMFRLADVYLMYAEAAVRGGADMGLGITYFNNVRERAYGDASHNVVSIDLDKIINERARELQWEGQRRTDLIRFGLFTGGTYLWPYKGNVPGGTATDEYLNIYPLPNADIVANPNLVQNPGY
ncbi:MAG: RagB/SusD family nutrient uptake outer membrane protein [Bacteroidetes bacterium]|nr:RagB/SusD family nutrient uptake outer membrane protein [Bacteroidota bacterium]